MAVWATDEQIIWNLKIVFMGMMVCLSCGVVGCFVVLRRMALLGDAVSHGISPVSSLPTFFLAVYLLVPFGWAPASRVWGAEPVSNG